MLDAAPVATTLVDADGLCRYVSPAVERLLGYRAEDLIGTQFHLLGDSTREAGHETALTELLANPGRPITTVFQVRHESGSWLWLETVAVNRLDDPAVRGIVASTRDITAQKQAEVALGAGDARFATVFRTSPAALGISTVDEGRFLDVNDRFLALTGYTRDEVIGRTVAELALWADLGARDRAVAALRERGGVRDLAATLHTKGGDERQIRLALAWTEIDGQSCVLTQAEDVTEWLRAEEALAASEARHRALVEQVPAVIYTELCDGTQTIAYISPYVETLLGFPPAAFAERRLWQQRIHPDDRARGRAVSEQSDATGDPYAAEYRMLARDGRTVWVQDAALLVRDAAGRPLCWQGVAYDVTAQREAQAALRERQERLLLALAAGGMETWDWDPQTGEVTWPESRDELVGTAPPTGRHTFDDFLASVHPDDRALVATKVGQALAGEGDYDPEYRKLQPDGTVRWHLSRGRVEWDAAGRAVRMRGVVLDITARKEAEAALWASEERLRLALEAAHVGAWDWHLPTDTVVWSPTLCALLGLPAESRTTTTAGYRATFVHPDHRSPAESAKFCVTGEAFAELEYRVVRPDGTVRWFADVGRLVERDPDGAPVRSAGVTIDVTERKALEARLAHDATHDPLTDLPNRALFADRLDQALAKAGERRRSAAVLFLDLDDFRIVNDSLGHAAGDQLLVSVAQRLSSALAPEATLARFGGDEFTVLLPAPTTTHDATQVAEHLLDRLRTPFRLAGRETHVDASVGVAMSSPALACPDDILRAADIALYHAKAAGRATHRVFEPSMAEQAAARLALESDLRRAVEREELLLYYQPEVDLATGAIVGAEALVRWQHPRRGLLGPGEFIPIAEESGLIVPIGAWVLTEACRQLSEWRNLGPTGKRLILGVNLSARQFRQPDLVQRVAATVRAAGLPPRQVKLELTERVVVEDAESETSVLRALRRLGVKLAIDDFGTGYSSLGYLRRWPVDTLKIDRSFVGDVEHDPGGQQLVGAMVGLAHALGADVTAEGIETPGQLSWLQGIGVERGQGYHFTPPMPAEDFVRLLAQNERYNFGPAPKVLPQPAKRGRRRPVQPRPANADRRSCDS